MKKLTVWVTSCGRIEYLKDTIESFIKYCTYPNYEMIIIESQMTEISKKFFNLEKIKEKETSEYILNLQERFPQVKFKIFIQPHKALGQVYDQLLKETGDYFVSIEDDLVTVCDPKDQFIDGIKMLDKDPKLLGIRIDLRDDTVYEGCSRFPETHQIDDIKYVVWKDWCSGGAQIMDARKVKAIGGYKTDHEPHLYIQTEHDQSAKMKTAGMYTAISLKYGGFLKHIGQYGVQGGDRTWTVVGYEDLANSGYCGNGSKKTQRKFSRDDLLKQRRDNGKP